MTHKYTNEYGDELVITSIPMNPGSTTHILEMVMSDGYIVKYIIPRKDLLHMLDKNLLLEPEA